MNLPSYTPFIIVGIFMALFAVEKLFPLRKNHAVLAVRLLINLAFSALAYLMAIIAVRPSALHTLNWNSQTAFGLLQLVHAPGWLRFIVGFLLLDLSFYYWHLINRHYGLLCFGLILDKRAA